jgi:hypothetical protein
MLYSHPSRGGARSEASVWLLALTWGMLVPPDYFRPVTKREPRERFHSFLTRGEWTDDETDKPSS